MASSRSRSYRPISAQRASNSGSRCGRPAFMGKSVLGRKSVALQSRSVCGWTDFCFGAALGLGAAFFAATAFFGAMVLFGATVFLGFAGLRTFALTGLRTLAGGFFALTALRLVTALRV